VVAEQLSVTRSYLPTGAAFLYERCRDDEATSDGKDESRETGGFGIKTNMPRTTKSSETAKRLGLFG
jgi:hypothetical protein